MATNQANKKNAPPIGAQTGIEGKVQDVLGEQAKREREAGQRRNRILGFVVGIAAIAVIAIVAAVAATRSGNRVEGGALAPTSTPVAAVVPTTATAVNPTTAPTAIVVPTNRYRPIWNFTPGTYTLEQALADPKVADGDGAKVVAYHILLIGNGRVEEGLALMQDPLRPPKELMVEATKRTAEAWAALPQKIHKVTIPPDGLWDNGEDAFYTYENGRLVQIPERPPGPAGGVPIRDTYDVILSVDNSAINSVFERGRLRAEIHFNGNRWFLVGFH